MFTIKGKYNSAVVHADSLEECTMNQIQSFLDHPAFADGNVAIMPDAHAGAGSCIGFTYKGTDEKVVPNLVGVDIGCGMLSCTVPGDIPSFESFDEHIRKNVPSGFNIHDTRDVPARFIDEGQRELYLELAEKVNQKKGKAIESIGSLGGGNHFIEIDETPEGEYIILIHTGSRNLGLCVAQYHQKKAKEQCTGEVPKDMEYLQGENADEYFQDMSIAQEYADDNRGLILEKILSYWNVYLENVVDMTTECVHNYVDFRDNTIRKGAISAHPGEPVIIPISMKDGTIYGHGNSDSTWNYSAPHGAGRVMSRRKAKKDLSLDAFRQEMEGIWTSCISESTLDEAPGAYKSMDEILDALGDSITVKYIAKPVYNFKA